MIKKTAHDKINIFPPNKLRLDQFWTSLSFSDDLDLDTGQYYYLLQNISSDQS